MNARMKPLPQTINYAGYSLGIETIGPKQATDMLAKNGCNRRLRKGVVQAYAEDMRRGNWLPKPIPICITPNGDMGNGQHTASAIVVSGCTFDLLIARNVPLDIIAVMDVGLKRSINDIAHFLSLDVDHHRIAMARAIEFGIGIDAKHHTFATLYEAYMQHEDAINFVMSHLKSRKIGNNVPVMHVIAKAWYSADRERLSEFMSVFSSGEISGPEDTAALRLRDWAMRSRSVGGSARIDLAQRATSAVAAFLRREPMTKIYGTSKDLYPTPHLYEGGR